MRMASESDVQMAENVERPHKEDASLWVHFYRGAVLDPIRTAEDKRPRFRDAIKIQIQVPGDKTLVIDREAFIAEDNPGEVNAHNNRFPTQWKAFLEGKESDGPGTKLDAATFISPSQIEELKYQKVRTIEQLASLTDANLMKIGAGAADLRNKARAFIQAQKDAAPMVAMNEALGSRDAEISTLKAQMAELLAAKGIGVPQVAPVAPNKRSRT